MLSNTFTKAVPLLKEKQLDIDYNALAEFLGHCQRNDWLYLDAMHRSLKTNIKTIYEILEICSETGGLEQYLQVYCPHCEKFIGQYYNTIAELPEKADCIYCDCGISNPLNHAIVIYKVL
ncbi:MAG: hypothetical protein NC489_36805 [Ruminococcus flavefaciens]|nr:hypothetical protein [Ruminococcus flavefaciens]